MYTHVSQVPARRQWEPSSAAPAPVGAQTMGYNCGSTSAAFVADFYRDATFPIEATCDLAAVCDQPATAPGTSGAEQAVMLAKRGVPATNKAVTLAQLKDLIKDGNRPVIIGMLMSRVPAAIRGHSFGGVHATVARQNAVVAGKSGILIMDPNFGYGHTVDTTNGARFYPDEVIAAGMAGYTAVVPNSPKAGAGGTDPMIEALNGYADGTYIPFEHGKAYQFFGFDPTTGARYSFGWTAPATGNLNVPTEGLVDLKGEGPAYFIPSMYAGQARKNVYLPQNYFPNGPVIPTTPATGITPEQLAAAVKKAAHEAAADVAVQADITLVSKYAEEKYPA